MGLNPNFFTIYLHCSAVAKMKSWINGTAQCRSAQNENAFQAMRLPALSGFIQIHHKGVDGMPKAITIKVYSFNPINLLQACYIFKVLGVSSD